MPQGLIQSLSKSVPGVCVGTFLHHILKNNVFCFIGLIYRQKYGTAMGRDMAPAFSNILVSVCRLHSLQDFLLLLPGVREYSENLRRYRASKSVIILYRADFLFSLLIWS